MRPLTRLPHTLALSLCALPLFGCALDAPQPTRGDTVPEPAAEQELHAHGFATHRLISRGVIDPTWHTGAGRFTLVPEQPVWQLGLMLDARPDIDEPVTWRARGVDGVWTDWHTAEITWREGAMMVGRIALAEPGTDIELELAHGVTEAQVELFETLRARRDTLARDLPVATPDTSLITRTQAVAPASLVISRANWGARDPGRICGSVVAPYRISIHHTAQPDSDGGDAAARMRQMQAYHMDTNGWCDIGYHFVVAQSGKIYQGRSDERRPGAHVGGQNSGNVGVSFIGNYQRDQVPQDQLDAGKQILDWIRQTYDIEWDTAHVKGHRQWPGQSTSCPGDNLLAKLPDLMNIAPVEPPPAKIDVEVNWLAESNLTDRLTQGSSKGLVDVVPGQEFAAELLISNRSSEPLRGIKLAYSIETPFLQATNYAIETDVPAKDRATWMTNDADSAPENPARDALGDSGEFTLYAMASGETKRVRIDFAARRYSMGITDHPDVRTWVKHIDGIYEDQTEWDQAPSVQRTDELLQAQASLDVISGSQWQFDAGEAEITEGWETCAEAIAVEVDTGSLPIASQGACILSPAWTSVNADRWTQLVLRVERNEAPSILRISWAEDASKLSDTRQLFVELPAQDTSREFVIPMSEAPGWTGSVGALELRTSSTQESEASGSLAIDAIYFQSGEEMKTNSAYEDYVEAPLTPISLTPPEDVDPTDPGTNNPGQPDPMPGMNPGMNPDPADPTTMMQPEEDAEAVTVNEGCATTSPSSTPSSPLGAALAMALGAVLARARRRRS